MKIGRTFMKTAEYLARQLTLAFDVLPAIRKPQPMKEARKLLAQAIRLIERSHKPEDGARILGETLRGLCIPYFGKADLWQIACNIA